MTSRAKLLAPVVAVSIMAATIGAAFAESRNDNDETNDQADILMMMNAKVTLAGAIQAAETAKGGKAVSASFEANNGQPAYEVEIAMAGGSTEAVLVDAQSGNITPKLTDNEQGENGVNEEGEAD